MSFRFRPLTRDDLSLLGEWLALPHVERWWKEDASPAAVEARYGPSVDGTDPTELFVIELDGEAFGFIQRYLLSDNPDWIETLTPTGAPLDGAGIDYLIGAEAALGNGRGPAMIAAFVADLWASHPDVESIVVDVDPNNRRSWRALEKVGFERIWTGELEAPDPDDAGPAHVYVLHRPG